MMQKPTEETIQKIDFVIQGLENGRFTELAKQIEFHEKLKGSATPDYFGSLIDALEVAESDIIMLQSQMSVVEAENNKQRQQLIDLEYKNNCLETDIKELGKMIKYLLDPKPLEKSYELGSFNTWLTNKSIY